MACWCVGGGRLSYPAPEEFAKPEHARRPLVRDTFYRWVWGIGLGLVKWASRADWIVLAEPSRAELVTGPT